jgi:hypothetical protein
MGYYKNESITDWTPTAGSMENARQAAGFHVVEPVEQIRTAPPKAAVQYAVQYETRRERRLAETKKRDWGFAGLMLAGLCVAFLLGVIVGVVV